MKYICDFTCMGCAVQYAYTAQGEQARSLLYLLYRNLLHCLFPARQFVTIPRDRSNLSNLSRDEFTRCYNW